MSYVNPLKFISWLKQEGLFSRVVENQGHFRLIFEELFKIRKRDELLIIGDLGEPGKRSAPVMTGCYVSAAKKMGLSYKLILQRPRYIGDVSSMELIRALDNLQDGGFITISTTGKLGSFKKFGKSFRKIVKARRFRFVSTPNLSELPTTRLIDLTQSLNIDYRKLQQTAIKIEKAFNIGKEIIIRTKAGTNLKVGIQGMKAIRNDGEIYSEFGGNIPVGEVYIPPRGKRVNGTVVLDGSVRTRYGTHLIKTPVVLHVENGSVVKITGNSDVATKLRETLDWAEKRSHHDWGCRRIGEVGIGINPAAKVVGPTVLNEKAKGTAHVAIGSNAWFGGSVYSIIHLDQVFMDARIYVDGALLKY